MAKDKANDISEIPSFAQWTVLLLLALGILISYVDRTSLSSAIAVPAFKDHFHLSDSQRGLINSAFFWSYGLVQLPMGWVVDRYGVKWPYALCFGLWCAATALTGMVDALGGLVLMRFLIGAAEAVAIPASYRWIRDNFPESQSGLAAGVVAAGNKFGPAIGAPVAAWLITGWDWRVMFVATGALGLVWLLPWLGLVKNDLPTGEARLARIRKASSVSLWSVLKAPMVWGALINNFCYGYFTFYCMQWMPAYLVEQRGLSLKQSGLYTFFSFAGIAIVAVLAGWAGDRLIAGGRDAVMVRKAFTIAGFIGASTVLLGAYAPSLDMALFWNVFSLSFLGLTTANNLALCRITLVPAPAVGLVTGVQQVATSLAGGVSGWLSGKLLEMSGSYDLPMRVIFVFLLIGAVSTWVMLRPEWAPKVADSAG